MSVEQTWMTIHTVHLVQTLFVSYKEMCRDLMFRKSNIQQICFLVDSLFMCSMYLPVQKHRQTKGNFTPKLMFLDVNVSWGKRKYCYIFWPGLSQLSSSSRYSLQAHVVYCTYGISYIVKVYSTQQVLMSAFYIERISHRSGLF